MKIRTRAITLTAIILAFSMMSVPGLTGYQTGLGIAQGQPTNLYPVTISLGVNEMVFFATHTSDLEDGNWIELSGGTTVELPLMSAVYEGPDIDYTRGGATVKMESDFIQGLTYPLPTHQVYNPGQEVTSTFWGSTDLGVNSVDFMLLRVSSLSQLKDVLDDGFLGIVDTLLDSRIWINTVPLNSDGDGTHSFDAPAAGDYILVASKIYLDLFNPLNSKFYIYSATAIEVVDYPLGVSAASSVEAGTDLSIVATLSGAPSASYTYGFAMINKDSYTGNIKLVNTGAIPTTELRFNDILMATGDLFTDFYTGTKDQSDLNINLIEETLNKAFSPNELSFAHSTTGYTALSTTYLTPGEYILFVGAWKDFETRTVGLYQIPVTVLLSPGSPVADAGGPYYGKPGAAITFDGTGSSDPDGTIVNYDWDFGDDTIGEGATVSHTYSSTGTYTVTLTVTDNNDLIDSDSTTATISTPPSPPPFIPPMNKLPVAEAGPDQTVYAGQFVEFSGVNSTDLDGTIDNYKWNFGDGTEASGVNVSHRYLMVDNYTVTLTVRDDKYGMASDTCTITVIEHAITPPPLPPYLDNLNITPAVIELGENVTINFDIRNFHNQHITYGVDIYVEDVNITRIWVELGAYEFKTVSHTITPDTIGIYNVTVHGMTGSFTVEAPEIPLRPAEFEVTDMVITPEEVDIGEEVEISFTVTNIGELPEKYLFSIGIEGPLLSVSKEMFGYLEAGESEVASYELKEDMPGTYSVEVDGLTGSFTVKAPPKPAEFEASNLVVTPREVEPGASVTVSAKITNVGDEAGGYIMEFKLDGSVAETKTVALNGGDSETVTFTTSSEEEGSHSVEIDGLSGSFTVEAPPPKIPTLTWIALISAIFAILLYMIWKKTDWIDQLRARYFS